MTSPSYGITGRLRSSPPRSEGLILGIDPGSRATGWSVVRLTTNQPDVVACGVIRLDGPHGERIREVAQRIDELVQKHQPDLCAVEDGYVGINPRSSLIVAEYRGIALGIAALRGVAVATKSPAEVKRACGVSGRATKVDVRSAAIQVCGLTKTPPMDAADAIAVALAAGFAHALPGQAANPTATAHRRHSRPSASRFAGW